MSKDFIVKTSRNNNITVSVFGESNIYSSPCIICVHGFKGFKDWGFWPYTANHLAEKGFFVLTFNFSHNGIGEVLTEFTEPEKFAENTISLEVEELKELLNLYQSGLFGKHVNNKIGLLGHSRGGGVSLLAARNNPVIRAAAVWASVANYDRYTERQKAEWKERGFINILNSRTKQMMRLNLSLLEDIENNKDDLLSIQKAVKNNKYNLYIAHGEQDLTVRITDAELIYTWSDKKNTILEKIPAAGHTFDIIHPFAGSNSKFDYLLNKTTNFFNNYLS
jgi:dienelactone hydrolase